MTDSPILPSAQAQIPLPLEPHTPEPCPRLAADLAALGALGAWEDDKAEPPALELGSVPQPAALPTPAAPCELGALCLGCTPRPADGSCPERPTAAPVGRARAGGTRGVGRPRQPAWVRFVASCAPAAEPGGCVRWRGACNAQGYPVFTVRDAADRLVLVQARRWLADTLWPGGLSSSERLTTTCGDRLCMTRAHIVRAAAAGQPDAGPLTPEARRKRAYRDVVDSPYNLRRFLSLDWPRSQMAVEFGLTEQQVSMIRTRYAGRDLT